MGIKEALKDTGKYVLGIENSRPSRRRRENSPTIDRGPDYDEPREMLFPDELPPPLPPSPHTSERDHRERSGVEMPTSGRQSAPPALVYQTPNTSRIAVSNIGGARAKKRYPSPVRLTDRYSPEQQYSKEASGMHRDIGEPEIVMRVPDERGGYRCIDSAEREVRIRSRPTSPPTSHSGEESDEELSSINQRRGRIPSNFEGSENSFVRACKEFNREFQGLIEEHKALRRRREENKENIEPAQSSRPPFTELKTPQDIINMVSNDKMEDHRHRGYGREESAPDSQNYSTSPPRGHNSQHGELATECNPRIGGREHNSSDMWTKYGPNVSQSRYSKKGQPIPAFQHKEEQLYPRERVDNFLHQDDFQQQRLQKEEPCPRSYTHQGYDEPEDRGEFQHRQGRRERRRIPLYSSGESDEENPFDHSPHAGNYHHSSPRGKFISHLSPNPHDISVVSATNNNPIVNISTRLPELEKWTNSPHDQATWAEFLEQFSMQVVALSIHETTWPKILPLYLADGALITYKNIIEKFPHVKNDFELLIGKLAKEFGDAGGVASSVDLYNRQKQSHETVGKYYSSICSMASRIYPHLDHHARDQIVLGAFLAGLPPSYKRPLLNNTNIKTSEEAFKIASRLERTNHMIIVEGSSKTKPEVTTEQVNSIESNARRDEEIRSMRRRIKELEMRSEQIDRRNQPEECSWRNDSANAVSFQEYRPRYSTTPRWKTQNWRRGTGNRQTWRNNYHARNNNYEEHRYRQQRFLQSRPEFYHQHQHEPEGHNERLDWRDRSWRQETTPIERQSWRTDGHHFNYSIEERRTPRHPKYGMDERVEQVTEPREKLGKPVRSRTEKEALEELRKAMVTETHRVCNITSTDDCTRTEAAPTDKDLHNTTGNAMTATTTSSKKKTTPEDVNKSKLKGTNLVNKTTDAQVFKGTDRSTNTDNGEMKPTWWSSINKDTCVSMFLKIFTILTLLLNSPILYHNPVDQDSDFVAKSLRSSDITPLDLKLHKPSEKSIGDICDVKKSKCKCDVANNFDENPIGTGERDHALNRENQFEQGGRIRTAPDDSYVKQDKLLLLDEATGLDEISKRHELSQGIIGTL